jgi:type II secretory pathway pseudopilin PulG
MVGVSAAAHAAMLVVLGVIATLAGMVMVLTRRVENQSNESILANAFALLKSALREYYEYAGDFPRQPDRVLGKATALAHVQLMYDALDSVPASRGVLKGIDSILVQRYDNQPAMARMYDPWGTALNYIYNPSGGDSFPEVVSAGPDKQFGTADDVSSKGK